MLTQFDKALLNIIQTDLPLTKRPFAVLAERLGVDEATVIDRLRALKALGYIRRIGPFFDSARLGYVGTLAAVRVRPDKVREVAEAINAFPGVTHNYEREGYFNLWFALLSPSKEAQRRVLQYIGKLDGVDKLISLPATRKYKVSVEFTLG
ncbi:AsnC family transcriptional regulator [Sporolituus thermophilus]|uniref:siroheme decarboxylase n=1 Tax=Sporolituus thermophilus DSM 23256 TaxID=1123285 RepID=A0A1G7J4R9_9FIRM|nr:AsnC family transcriptional regulator [Sporolituus thermophilus]SDF19774.1 DNA-binding transcriptional regulator, Lrp family [Sporolituus thermophilus DSM 23256]